MERAFLSVFIGLRGCQSFSFRIHCVTWLALTIMVSHACSPCMISFYEYSIEEKWLLCTHGPVSIFADSVSDSLQVCNKTCGTCLKSVSSMKMPSL